MTPVNDRLRDALLRRAALSTRHENALLRDLLTDWRRATAGMLYALRSRGDLFTRERAAYGVPAPDRHSRLQREVLVPLRALIDDALARAAHRLGADLQALARRELREVPELLQRVADAALPADDPLRAEAVLAEAVGVSFDAVPEQQVAVLLATPAGGSFFQTGLARLGQQVFGQAQGLLVGGLVQGRGVEPLARGLQGILGGARWQAERIVRSEYVRAGNQANLLTFERNKALLDGVMWVSTLDRRTCLLCASLDGRRYRTVAQARVPVQGTHPNCRCVLVPIVKRFTALKLPPGTRASFSGQVPATVKYADWFPRQGAAFQRAVLGPTRYRLWQSGALKLGDFSTAAGVKAVADLPAAKLAVSELPWTTSVLGRQVGGPWQPGGDVRLPRAAVPQARLRGVLTKLPDEHLMLVARENALMGARLEKTLSDRLDGVYNPNTGFLAVNPRAKNVPITVTHEFAHALDHAVKITTGGAARWPFEFVTEYAKTDSREAFAEAYAMFASPRGRTLMRERFPGAYAYMERVFGAGRPAGSAISTLGAAPADLRPLSPARMKAARGPEDYLSEEEKLAEKFARRETPAQRAARIRGKKVPPAEAETIRRALGIEKVIDSGKIAAAGGKLSGATKQAVAASWRRLERDASLLSRAVDVRDAISIHTSNDATKLLRALRSGAVPRREVLVRGHLVSGAEYVRTMDRVIQANARLPRGTVLWRGVANISASAADDLVGKVVVDRAFSSTTVNPSVASGYAGWDSRSSAVFRIEAGGGRGFAVPERLAQSYARGSQQVILARGARLRVTGVERVAGAGDHRGKTVTIIHARLL